MSMFERVLVPVANEEDAVTTCAALRPYLDQIESAVAIHVIEKAGGAVDKAPLEKRQTDATAALAAVEEGLGDEIPVETRVVYGTDVVDTLFEAAGEEDATGVVFRARGGNRIVRLIAGDTTTRIVTDPTIPVISLPDPEDPQ